MSVTTPSDEHAPNLKDHAIALLDSARHAYDTARINRIRYMTLGRQYGMTYSEIGEVLGISADGVRMALKRAGDV